MAITEALRLVVQADTQGAVKGIENLGRTADRELSKSEKTAQRWGNHLTRAGTGMIAFGAVAVAGLASTAQAASDLGEVMSKNTVVFDDSSKKVEEFAEGAAKIGQSKRAALEAATGFGNLFTSMGLAADKSADMSIELTTLASDLASFSNTSPEEAIEALTSALIGEAEPIRKYGVLLDDATLRQKALDLGLTTTTSETLPPAIKAQAAYAAILEQTTNAQGDFGRTSDSAANQQRVLAANFENLKASIGQGVLPAMTSLLNIANDVVGGLSEVNAVTDGTLGKVATIGTAALIAGGGISTLAGQLLKSKEGFLTLIDAGSSVIEALGGVKGAAVAAAGAAGIGALIFAAGQLEAANQSQVLDEMVEGFQAVDFAASEAAKTAIENADALGILDELFERVQDSSSSAAHKLVELIDQTDVGSDTAEHYRKELEQHDEATKNATASQEEMTGAVGEGAAAMGENATATEDAKSALEEYSAELKGLVDPLFAAMDAVNGNRDAQLAYTDAQAAVLTAQHELDEAIRKHGRNSDEAAAATRTLEDAQRGLTDAEWGTVESAAEVDSALAALKDAVDQGTVSTDVMRTTLQSWVAQGFLTQEQANRAAISIGGLASEAEEADKQRVDIPVREDGGPRTRTELRAVRDAAFGIPRSRNTHVSASGASTVIANLDNIARRLNALDDSSFHISVGGGGGLTLHEGGFVPGPLGQEVAAVLQAGEFVVPLPQAQALGRPSPFAGGGGMSGRLDVSVTDDRTTVAFNGQVIAETLARHNTMNYGRDSARIR